MPAAGLFMTVLVLLSLVLSVFHLPDSFADWFSYWRPQWLLLALVFWGAAGSPLSRRTVHEFVRETSNRRGRDDASCVVGCLAVWLLCGRAVG